MALGTDYPDQDCSLARALELVGERWTMLIVRDAFFGVRRFTDFTAHLDISKAILTRRLDRLVAAGVMQRTPRGGHDDYTLTERGVELWPALFALTQWGARHASAGGPRRRFSHCPCRTDLAATGVCPACHTTPPPTEVDVRPARTAARHRRDDPVSVALRSRHRLLTPLALGTD